MPILKEEEVIVFRGYPSVLRKMPQPKKNLIQKFQTIHNLLAVNPTSNAANERSLSFTGVRKQGLDPTQGETQESNLATLDCFIQHACCIQCISSQNGLVEVIEVVNMMVVMVRKCMINDNIVTPIACLSWSDLFSSTILKSIP